MENPSHRIGLALFVAVLAFGAGRARAATIYGTVSEPPQYIPIAGARVYLLHGPTKQIDSLRTDSAGAYRFAEVAGCEGGCSIRVSNAGFWTFDSFFFTLDPDGSKQLDVALERIHSLTIRVVRAEDTSQAVPTSQAVMFSSANEPPRCQWADSTGRMQFKDLQSFTGYLLSVSAPGRKATSNMLHFHDPVSNGFWRVSLDSDVADTGKSLRGRLSARNGGSAAGARLVLSCRNDRVAADLFAVAGTDGGYAIMGVPPACDSVTLYAGTDTAAAALPDKDNHFDWSVWIDGPAPVGPGRAPRAGARPIGPLWRGYDLAGRKLNAVRARFRP